MTNRAVFLDRDGVVNHSIVKNDLPFAPLSIDELIVPDDAFDALQRLKAAGFLLIVVTNQPDVSRGKTSQAAVEEINNKLMELLPIDEIRVCYHDDADTCRCRKPLPGLLLEAAGEHMIDLKKSFMIGDRWKDIEAGQAAGCQTILLQQNYKEKAPTKPADYVVGSLTEVAAIILA